VAEAELSEREASSPQQKYSAIVDIGKTRSRLLLVDDVGRVAHKAAQPSHSCQSGLGYDALDTAACEAWLRSALRGIGPLGADLRRIIVTTHGAAFAALKGNALALPVPDYEAAAFDQRLPTLADDIDGYQSTLSPLLPRGLNMGVQLDWLSRHAPDLLASADTFMPYAQYWAWWLSDVKASEVSSLGCHTLLWKPVDRGFSNWATSKGWAQRFAPQRRAWEVLGLIRPELADELGIPRHVQVHVGVHDSNACLARYLREWPRMTLVSSGTWVVVMSPGAFGTMLRAGIDQLGNVSVRGDAVPTGRFMGGRELAHLCAGADPALADMSLVPGLLEQLQILPGFEPQGGAFGAHAGRIVRDGHDMSFEAWSHDVEPRVRATAASLYLALMTAWTIRELGGLSPIVIDGPLAHNAVASTALAALLHESDVYLNRDPLEGTARGAWMLTRWTAPQSFEPAVDRVEYSQSLKESLASAWVRWSAELPTLQTAEV
jgi:sugar (pentulose or hexulose) kinase